MDLTTDVPLRLIPPILTKNEHEFKCCGCIANLDADHYVAIAKRHDDIWEMYDSKADKVKAITNWRKFNLSFVIFLKHVK